MNVWLAVGATIGGLSWIPVLIRVLVSRPKSKADAAAVLAETATELLEPLRAELREARIELGDTRAEMRALREHLTGMEDLLRRNGIPTPPFMWPPAGNGKR